MASPITRQDFTTTIRELDGKTVERLEVMVVTWDGAVEDAQRALLKVRGGRWHRFLVDAGVLFWEEQDSVDESDRDTHSPDPRRTYALRTVDEAAGARLGVVRMEQVEDEARLTIGFADGRRLVFTQRGAGTDGEATSMEWRAAGQR